MLAGNTNCNLLHALKLWTYLNSIRKKSLIVVSLTDNKMDNIWQAIIKCILHILIENTEYFHPTPLSKTVVY